MQRAVSPKPVAAILATTLLSVAARTLHRSLTSPVCGFALFPKVGDSNSLQFLQKQVVLRGKSYWGKRKKRKRGKEVRHFRRGG